MSGILRSDLYLLEHYVPMRLPHREKELQEIAAAIKPLFDSGKPFNVVLTGPPGTGKTSCAKYVLNEIEQHTSAFTAYINCWTYTSRTSIYAKILLEFGIAVPRQGVSTDYLFEVLLEFFKKGRKAVIVLDEFDQLLKERAQILYELALINSWFPYSLALIVICYKRQILARMAKRVQSRFSPKILEFRPYSKQALIDILADRVKLAFRPGSVEEEALELIAEKAVKRGGDARVALELLLEAGREADIKEAKLTASLIRELLSL